VTAANAHKNKHLAERKRPRFEPKRMQMDTELIVGLRLIDCLQNTILESKRRWPKYSLAKYCSS
jgi:hypothetical protein